LFKKKEKHFLTETKHNYYINKKGNMSNKSYKDKRMNIIVNKIGLSEENALWCIDKDKKYAIWLANQIKNNQLELNQLANANVDLILDWKKENQEINLNDYTFNVALKEARKFQKTLFVPNPNGLKNTNVVIDCGDYKWVQLITKEDCREEGSAMGHCIGNSSHSSRISSGSAIAFSLRDKFNRPHISIEASSNDRVIIEMKGSSNQIPKDEYVSYFVDLFKKYHFTGLNDYYGREMFLRNSQIVEEINELDDSFFDFDFKLEIGLQPFEENEIYIKLIEINSNINKTIDIPDNTRFTNTLKLVANKVSIGSNLLIGGDLILECKTLKIGDNIKVGGNFKTNKQIKNIENKVECFGEFQII
jgi:hypothetical protein